MKAQGGLCVIVPISHALANDPKISRQNENTGRVGFGLVGVADEGNSGGFGDLDQNESPPLDQLCQMSEDHPCCQLFVGHSNSWRTSQTWPLNRRDRREDKTAEAYMIADWERRSQG